MYKAIDISGRSWKSICLVPLFCDCVDAACSYYDSHKESIGIYWDDVNIDDPCILIKELRKSGAWVTVCGVTFGGGIRDLIHEPVL